MRARARYRWVFVFCIVQGCISTAFALWAAWRAWRPVEYTVNVQEVQPIDPALLEALTNTPRLVSSPGPLSADSAAPGMLSGSIPLPPRCVFSLAYRYSVVGSRRFAVTDDETLTEGDETCFGVVSRIWPQRIVLASGDWIDRASNKPMEVRHHDRISELAPSGAD